MTEVYRSTAGRNAVQHSYRGLLDRWPVPADRLNLSTRHGDTFVIASGPVGAPPTVLLHGAGTNSAIWMTDAASWSRSRRVYLVDVIGEPGLSATSRPKLDSGAHAAWLDDVLDGLDVSAGAFVGASLGGWLALDYAIRRPARVERLALRAPGGVGRQKYGAVAAALLLMPFGDRGRRTALRLALAPTDVPDTFVDYMALLQKHYLPRRDRLPVFTDDQLRAVRAPLLVIVGARDRMLDSQDTAGRIARLVPHADVRVIPDAGHGLTVGSETIHQFLDSKVKSESGE